MKNISENPEPNIDLHLICPICASKSIGGCRCMLSDQQCKNGHHWYLCPKHNTTIIGQSDHAKSVECHCDASAFYRT